MANLTSSLTIKLIDDVTRPARSVAQALKDTEKAAASVAKGMGKVGSDPFKRSLAGLKLTASELRTVKKEWVSYAQTAKQSMGAEWATKGAGAMRAWERQTIASIRAAKREQIAYNKAIGAAAPGAKGGRFAGLGRMGGAATDFASYALPGAAGMAVGLGAGAAGGLAVGGAAAYSMKQAVEFDKAMADVRKKVTLGPGETIADVEAIINRNAKAYGIARTEMAALAAQAGQSGIAMKDLSGFMQTAAKVSSAWDISAQDAALSLANVKAQTGWNNEQLALYADKVNYLGDISASAEKNINTMWAKTSAGAKAAGVSYDESMIAMTALNSVGMDADVSSRFFGQLTSRLRTATSQKGVGEALKSLGMDAKDVEKRMQTDGLGTVIDFLDRLSKSKDGVKAALGVGGKEWFDEILRAKEALQELIRLRNEFASGNFKGSLDSSMSYDLDTTAKKFEQLKASASELADALARPMLPGLNSVLDAATSQMSRLVNLINPKELPKQPGSFDDYNKKWRFDEADAPKPAFRNIPGAGFGIEGGGSWARDMPTSSVMPRANIAENVAPAFVRMQAKATSKTLEQIVASEAGKDSVGWSLRGIKMREREGLTLPKTPEVITALPPRRPEVMPKALPKQTLEQPVEVLKKVVSESPIAMPSERPAKALQQAAPPAPQVRLPPPPPVAAPVIKPAVPQEMKVTPSVAPVPAPPPQQIQLDPVLGPIPAIAAQELKITPSITDVPQLPAQEMTVIPKIDTSGLNILTSAAGAARGSLNQLQSPVSVNVNTSALDSVAPKANSAHAAVQTVAAPVSVHVDTSSLDAAISKAHALKAALAGVGSAAASAAASASAAAGRVSSAAQSIRSSYSPSSAPGAR